MFVLLEEQPAYMYRESLRERERKRERRNIWKELGSFGRNRNMTLKAK